MMPAASGKAAGTGQHRKAKDNPVPATTVQALIARQWILEPDLDLFEGRHSGPSRCAGSMR